MRAAGFFLFASAYWALLPLVARNQIAGGPGLYGILLGAIGAGAVGGAFAAAVAQGEIGTGPADGARRRSAPPSRWCCLASRTSRSRRSPRASSPARPGSPCLATLNVSAQVALPDWVRGRGLALYHDRVLRLPDARQRGVGRGRGHARPAARAFHRRRRRACSPIPLTWRWKLQTGAGIDLTPSMHWPAPITAQAIEHDRGPVLVDGRIPHPAAGSRSVPASHRRARPRAAPRRRLCLGRVRGRRRGGPHRRDLPRRILDGAFAPARARHQCRSPGRRRPCSASHLAARPK